MIMRTIKFRGKCAHTDAWVYGSLVDYGEDEATEIHGFDPYRVGEEEWRNVVVDRWTVGQFTGLKDKNGKEIYEGDVVLVSDWTSVYASDYKGTVCFKRGQWVVSYEKYGCKITPRLFFDDFSDRKTTIIGNIYDNSELLKTDSND